MNEGNGEQPKYRSVSILSNLMEEVEKIIKDIYGFSTASAYIHACIRRKLSIDKATVQMEKDEKTFE